MQAIALNPITSMPGTIKSRVSELAGKRKLQIASLAREADVSYDTAKRYWYDDADGITWEVLIKLCDALGCTPGELLEYVPETNGKNGGR